MQCPRCRYENAPESPACNLCGELLREGAGVPAPPPMIPGAPAPLTPAVESAPQFRSAVQPSPPGWKERLAHPWASIGVGLLAVPVAKALWIPNYVFNFLTTLVHECGHALFAWGVGRPSIPSVSIAGGGMTGWADPPRTSLALFWMAVLGWFLYKHREDRRLRVGLGAALGLYPFLAFTRMNSILPSAGGILLEIGAAAACFFVVLAVDLERPFERPLYALWGWWMLLNRGAETVLMLRSPAYRTSQAIIESGLAAGMTSDLEVLRIHLGGSPTLCLWIALLLCLTAFPAAWGAARYWRSWQSAAQANRPAPTSRMEIRP